MRLHYCISLCNNISYISDYITFLINDIIYYSNKESIVYEANEIIEDSKKVFFKLFKEESETIDSVISPGYLINGKVIRTSKVLILLN